MAGRVVRVAGRDTVAVPGAEVTLHRVTVKTPGPIDSLHSDAAGRFRFRIAPDSGVVYLVSARWDGIEYFATPFVVHADSPPPALVVVVSDTSSSVPIQLVARHLIVSPPSADGTRDIVDLFVINNAGPTTRVAPGADSVTWRARLPPFAINVRPGNSEFSPDAFRFVDGESRLMAAIPPGQRDIEIDYQVPPNSPRFEVPVDVSADISNIISADRTMRVSGAFTRSDTVIDRKPYARWQGSLTAGRTVALEFGATTHSGTTLLVLLTAMTALLVTVTVVHLRRAA